MGNSFDTPSSIAIIVLAALVHASFQLSVSVLTLLSGHALGRKTAHRRLLNLAGGFIGGATTMTLLLLTSVAAILSVALPYKTPTLLWTISCGLVFGVGISVWLFYYRKNERGTTLWVPRGFARYLGDRSKVTKAAAETFGLGLTSVIAELLFVFAPVFVAALVLIRMTPDWQIMGTVIYCLVSLFPLFIVGALVGGGNRLSSIQRWRESNKRFLQFAAGSGMLVLGLYVYVEQVMTTSVVAATIGGQ